MSDELRKIRDRRSHPARRWCEQIDALRALDAGGSDPSALSRRAFLHLVGAAGAGLAMSGCFDPPEENILPYTRRPLDVIPGMPRAYATTIEIGGYGIGLHVESREGRPTKIEGNPLHPASLGATGAYAQASILGLYDPWRVQQITRRGVPADWSGLLAALGEIGPERALRPIHILLEPTASPLCATLLDRAVARRPGSRVYYHSPLAAPEGGSALERIFGAPAEPLLRIDRASVVLSVDSDFTTHAPFAVRYSRELGARRHVRAVPGPAGQVAMLRLYAVESAPTPTGTLADHRIERPPRAHAQLLRHLLVAVARGLSDVPEPVRALASRVADGDVSPETARFVRAVAADLLANRGKSLVVVGAHLPREVHALGAALNAVLGSLGSTLELIPPVLRDDRVRPSDPFSGSLPLTGERAGSLADLVAAMRGGEVETLVMLGSNPVYSAPSDLDFARALAEVPTSVYLGVNADETAERAMWLVPQRHYLESWGDARAFDGTASLIQPLIRPLYPGTSSVELLATLAGESEGQAHGLLRQSWQARAETTELSGPAGRGSDGKGSDGKGSDGEGFNWEDALRDGVIRGTAVSPMDAAPSWDAWASLVLESSAPAADADAIDVQYRPDTSVNDGSFAGNPWLQELPDPITKLTWDNAAWLAPLTAVRLGVESGDWIAIDDGGRRLEIPALVVPGHALGAITVHLGYGHRAGSPIAVGAGFNAYRVRRSDTLWLSTSARVVSLSDGGSAPGPYPFAITQVHMELGPREHAIAPVRSLAELGRPSEPPPRDATLFPIGYPGEPQWGMAIDLNACTGCSACVVACQAENNVPVVGKEEVARGREMHWLRIDRYRVNPPESVAREAVPFTGGEPLAEAAPGAPESAPLAVSQPMLCQHCETAPCEYVCPVNATVHSPDGLNEMVYNRCIGTRFCSNNCPYKVRRFNWFDYNADLPPTRQMQMNPDVTVRARGVMEKCTYCVQRIRSAEIAGRREGRPLADGDVVTACQQACPTGAIRFGNVADPESEVSRVLRAPQVFSALGHLGTRPRTQYLARLRDVNPLLARGRAKAHEEG